MPTGPFASRTLSRARVVVLASAIIAAAGLACSEELPRELTVLPAEVTTNGAGIDARPTNPSCKPHGASQPVTSIVDFVPASPVKFSQPVEVVVHAGRTYVVEQPGRVRVLATDGASASTALDVTASIVAGGEAGLLGLAFHPKFAENHFVYVYFTAPHPTQPPPTGVVFQSVVARFTSNDGGLTFDPSSVKRILTVDQPFSNHNGGTIAFGNDGFLYFGLGDGGSGGDPMNVAQNPNELLGKMVRIDVDGGDPYAIPSDNPFATAGGRPEIFAIGLRNPFRFRFDPPTGDLWAGDVGQSAIEEIDKITLGKNYGWKIKEGRQCYPPGASCASDGLVDPIAQHGRSEAASITGGVVYRGTGIPSLTGKYVYGDFSFGNFWAIATNEAAPVPLKLNDATTRELNPSAFALDTQGEVLVLDYTAGDLLRMVPPSAGTPVAADPTSLGDTGCVDITNIAKPAAGLVPYDVVVPQWLDGATATRFVAIPDGTKIVVKNDGALELPPSSIALRTISAEKRNLETQMVLRRADGSFDVATYVWSDDQRTASLTTEGASITLPSGRVHQVPPRAACLTCHDPKRSPTIGLEVRQLDKGEVDYRPYGGRLGNPIVTFGSIGLLDAPVASGATPALVATDGFDPSTQRARSYLHANCAFCHRAGTSTIPGNVPNLDLSYGIPIRATGSCGVTGALKTGGAYRLAPGRPEDSQIVTSIAAPRDAAGRMPPVGGLTVDNVAVTLVSDLVRNVQTCE